MYGSWQPCVFCNPLVAHVIASEHDARCNTDKKVAMLTRKISHDSGDLHYHAIFSSFLHVFWLCNAAASLYTGHSRSHTLGVTASLIQPVDKLNAVWTQQGVDPVGFVGCSSGLIKVPSTTM